MSIIMRPGDRSNEVVALQNALNWAIEKEPPLKIDGIYGEKTARAVRIIQRRFALTLDAVAGPQTLSELFEVVTARVRVSLRGTPLQTPHGIGLRRPRPGIFAPPQVPPRPKPSDAVEPPSLSLGMAALRLQQQVIQDWQASDTPDGEIEIPDLPSATPLRIHDLRKIGAEVKQESSQQSSGQKKYKQKSLGLGLDVSLGALADFTSKSPELDANFTVKFLSPKFARYFQHSSSLYLVDKYWEAKSQIDFYPVKLFEHDWGPINMNWKSGLSGSFVLAKIGQRKKMYPKGKLYIGNKLEVAYVKPLRQGHVRVFMNTHFGVVGCVEYKEGKASVGCVAPGWRAFAPDLGVAWGLGWVFR